MNFADIKLPTLSDEEWDKGKALAVDWCKGGLGSHSLMPHLFIWSTQDVSTGPEDIRFEPVSLMLMACGFEWNNESKRWFLRSVAAKLVRERRLPIAIIFAHEAWQSRRALPPNLTDEQIKEEMSKAPMPADDPNAWEVVCAAGLRLIGPDGHATPLDPAASGWGWTQKVSRDAEDKMVADGEPVECETHQPQFIHRLLHWFAVFAAKLEPLPPEGGDGGMKMKDILPKKDE